MRVRLPLAVALSACVLSACTGQRAPGTDCRPPAQAVLPHTDGTLAETDRGAFCLANGRQLTVFLTAPAGTRWSPVRSSDPKVLAPAKAPLTAPVGVTPALFGATGPGTAELTSQDGTGGSWRVTVVVR